MSRPTTYCEKCGEYVGFRWDTVGSTDSNGRFVGRTLRVLAHIDADGNYIYRAHAPKLDERGSGDYSKQPRRGDVIDSGRFGYVTVVAVRDHGRTLDVETWAHRCQTITRADQGVWWRIAKADGV